MASESAVYVVAVRAFKSKKDGGEVEVQLIVAIIKQLGLVFPGRSDHSTTLRSMLWIFPIFGSHSCEPARTDTRTVVPNSPLDRVEDPRSISPIEGQ